MSEQDIIQYLSANGPSYTKVVYRYFGSKNSGLSLNKFRKLLENMSDKRMIQKSNGDYPLWTICEASP